jgi:hypothetical protein|tara:strand:+ start:4708 stop:5760 length:1053 start_codon:yes stop_codon:yes gene_type:complete
MIQDVSSMTDSYYGPHAYDEHGVPNQQRQTVDPGRSWINRKFDMRLPWGLTEEVAPQSFRKRFRPEVLREIESKPSGFESIEFHQQINHEMYRHAPPAFRTRLLRIVRVFGKVSFWALLIPMLIAYGYGYSQMPYNMTTMEYFEEVFWSVIVWAQGLPLLAWAICNLIFRGFPKWAIKPSKGPQWELNRRTGLVTLFRYDKKGRWGKARQPEEDSAPFYEFDAYLTNEIIPPGQVVHTLYLVHRYRPILIPLGNLIGKSRGEECFALWDMFQNFMDTSRSLPDIPLWEEFRPHDPVTAEYDKKTNRPARYWRDMDDETWKQKESEMMAKVRSLTTPHRPNLMRRHVRYAS